jgi:predicted RNase H-like HicB family nuclease
MSNYDITATWDDEAKVWVAESSDVPGLATEAATKEELVEKLKVVIPELLEAKASGRSTVPDYVMHWHRQTRRMPC